MKLAWTTLLFLSLSWSVHASDDGMKDKLSQFSFQETQTRLESAIREKGLTLFAKIDHADGAKQVGLVMRPATVFIFGNAKGGTPFMIAAPKSAIDFPMKALVWENAEGKILVSYNDMNYIVTRHRIVGQDTLAKKLTGVLDAIAKAATE